MSQANIDTSTAEPARTPTAIEEVSDGLSELESPVLRLRNLAYPARMLASSDDMPKEAGAALDSLADTLVNELDAVSEERYRLWSLSREAVYPPKAERS